MADRYGLDESEQRELCGIFASIPEIEEVVIYGSRARGSHRPTSDIDITLKGEGLTEAHLSLLDDRLYYSSLPYLTDTSIFDRLRNPDFVANIRRDGKTLYRRDGGGQKATAPDGHNAK